MNISFARKLVAERLKSGAWSVAATGLLVVGVLLAGGVWAQNAPAPKAKIDAAHAAWRKLSQAEVNCVDKALIARNSQIWMLIQRGVGPGDSSVASVRAGCRAQANPQTASAKPAPAHQAPVEPKSTNQSFASKPLVREHWSFNGSMLNMVVDGRARRFFYLKPGPEAEAAGAQRGDLFLEASVSDQRIGGTVYVHDARCGRIPYRVDGTIRENSRRLELQGQKPHLDGHCTVVGTVLDALTFAAADAEVTVAVAPAAVAPAAKSLSERAAALMASVDRSGPERAEADDHTEFKPVSQQAAVEPQGASQPANRVANQAAPVRIVLAGGSEAKIAVNEAVAEKASAGAAVQIAQAEAARAQAQADLARNEAEKAVADAIATAASAQSTIAFLYGLACGPALLGAGALVFLALRRRYRLRLADAAESELQSA